MKYTPYLLGISLIFVIWFISSLLLDDSSSRETQRKLEVESAVDHAVKKQLSLVTQPDIIAPNSALSNIPIILPIPEKLDFCGEPVPLDSPDILERFEKELYITVHRYYQVIFYLKRGPRIFPELEDYLKRENLPLDFIYLSVIESDLIPNIRSPKGALGLWQFMPETAKRYQLKMNQYVDERMHTEKATIAAARYLKEAYKKLGSWTLAAASYNMGVARTAQSIEEQHSKNYYKLFMNEETSRYIFRILAAKVIIENPSLYGYSLPISEVYKKVPTRKVTVNQPVNDLALWAKKNHLTYYDLKRYNPWIINNKLPKGSYELEIPF